MRLPAHSTLRPDKIAIEIFLVRSDRTPKRKDFAAMKGMIVLVAIAAAILSGVPATSDAGEKEDREAEAVYKAMSPGPHHELFNDLVGSWNAEITWWEAPGTEPVESQGLAEYKVILGGRYLMQQFAGEMMGMPFEGVGLSGYDATTDQHTFVWCDNMGTQMMYSTGVCTDHCKTQTHVTTVRHPMTKQETRIRMVSTVIGHDKHIFEYYMAIAGTSDGWFKSMQIVYTRS